MRIRLRESPRTMLDYATAAFAVVLLAGGVVQVVVWIAGYSGGVTE